MENNSLQVQNFMYQSQEIHSVLIDGEIWWVLKDVCAALGLKNPTMVAKTLDPDELTKFNLGSKAGVVNIVSEPGLYGLLMQSRKPEARPFKRWIKHEVIPQIRKTGSYSLPQVASVPAFITADFMQRITDQMRSLEQQVADQQLQIEYMEPKAEFYDYALQSSEGLTTTTIAKEFGLSAQKLNNLLHEWGIQYKQGGIWHLYDKYVKDGYHVSHVHILSDGKTVTQMRWTHKGRKFIHDLLIAHKYVPVVQLSGEETA